MSGGRWNYEDGVFFDRLAYALPEICKTLEACFNHVDYAESGDTSKEQAKEHLYHLINELGDKIFTRR
jgi:hypothetical protein